MSNEIRLADLVVDCPDAIKLSQFYHELLGWKTTELFGNPAVVSENGVMLVFVQEDVYKRQDIISTHPASTEDDVAWEVIKALGAKASRLLLPMFEESQDVYKRQL